ncbi:hypothetical protein B0A48_00947 [Cryoendolithus antarcticus]|uniref:Uncharacterized protein n=1 Tax=Cryoendolithus antarcticus TaxID=1507870 RepID=A0A1V8TRZ1_9PEZI|nr:hypothetical protein B0A48_00947 [Cryoendolithus antarcticus]
MASPPPGWQSSNDTRQWIARSQPVARRPEDEENFERNWSWNSGNASGVVHESRQSWSTTTQTSTPQVITTFSAPPMPITPAIAMPVMQPPMPAMPSMHDFHQQSQQMMNDFHQNALDSHSRMVETMNNSMSMGMRSSYSQPQQQVSWHSSSTLLESVQQQITYQSSSTQAAPVQQQLTYHSAHTLSPPIQQQPAQIHYTQNVFHQAPPQPQKQQLQISQQNRIFSSDESARFQAIEKTRDSDMREIKKQGTAMRTQMHEIEHQLKEAQKRQDDSSQRQIKDLQDRIAESARRQLEDARRHDAEMEELRRNQRSARQPQAPALDMDALRTVILETQAKQISAADVQRAVEEAVAQRLVGVARKEDLEAASSSMQKALSKVPQGASEEQVQNALGKELNKIVERVERHQRREIEAAPPPQQQPWARPQPEFTIEEIDDDEPAAVPVQAYQPATVPVQQHQPSYQPAQPRASATTQLASVPIANTAPQSGAIARIKKSNNPAPPPRVQSSITAVVRSSHSPPAQVHALPPMSGAVARLKKPSEPVAAPPPTSSTVMVRPGARNTPATPAQQQPIQQTPSAPAARPARQMMPPPAPTVAPNGALVRQSKDVAKKPR